MMLSRTGLQLVIPLLLACAVAADDAGPETCLGCHTASADVAVHAIFQTVHGGIDGGGAAACAACHGDSAAHASSPGETPPEVSFGPRWQSSAQIRADACRSCHDKDTLLHWPGSDHQREGLSCDSCHDSHRQQDAALVTRQSQRACLDCHVRVQSEILLPSRHPIVEGKTGCGDCHNPHGSLGDSSLRQLSVNDNCQQCHQETRGPFLWEHAPASEDCGLCHRPHGSMHDRLLTARGPALCQQCHVAAFHPSLPYGAEGLAGGGRNGNLLGRNCLNCHSQVHGSNHPSGARLTR